MNEGFSPGSIVRVRDREWILEPSRDAGVLQLRPLMGGDAERIALFDPLGLERLSSATFPLPDPNFIGDFASARLLLDAARLSLRSGAGPLRSLGHISVRPRPYQFVPLLMALRLDPVRLLIADDVGIGKTIEAGLIARELLDRGEIQRLAVLCPPYLCEQWKQELEEKFNIPAVIVRSGTVSSLERELPSQDVSIFQYFPYMVISIDYAKSGRRIDSFVLHCPEMVIVDEAHTAARPVGRSASQQQRHDLVRRLAEHPKRHLLLLTAMPHSGVEESFRSILGLLDRRFESWDLPTISESQRIELAKHFVQRRRADVKEWMGESTPFPTRDPHETSYRLEPDYRAFAEAVYEFASELVEAADRLSGFQRRIRYWTALALMRSVLSSPAAAVAALEGRATRLDEGEQAEPDDAAFSPYVYDAPGADEAAVDVAPSYVIDEGEQALSAPEQRRLRQFAAQAASLGGKQDRKLQTLIRVVSDLLDQGRHVLVYCRYIATAEYASVQLNAALARRFPGLRVLSVTGTLAEDERRARVLELADYDRRVLVATDCLSEGINLQDWFDAVIHYDLPWNPNRLEQREGRADRFGQRAEVVPAYLLYGEDNPVDGAVLDVLIRKAVQIRRVLGITVPVPIDSESVIEAVVNSLFRHRTTEPRQLALFGESPFDRVDQVHEAWDRSADQERISRTRFAQHAIKPAEVAQELEQVDAVLGDPDVVERFVLEAAQRLGAPLVGTRHGWKLDSSLLPADLQDRLGFDRPTYLVFSLPVPERAMLVGRNHRLVAGLAEYLLAAALDTQHETFAGMRCGAVRTYAVSRQTNLLMLRIRHVLQDPRAKSETLAEECIVVGIEGAPPHPNWLPPERVGELLEQVTQPDKVTSPEDASRRVSQVVSWLEDGLASELKRIAVDRSEVLHESHERVRQAVRLGRVSVKPVVPVDVLGVFVLIPIVQ